MKSSPWEEKYEKFVYGQQFSEMVDNQEVIKDFISKLIAEAITNEKSRLLEALPKEEEELDTVSVGMMQMQWMEQRKALKQIRALLKDK